jgi:hypothetical protein
MQGSMPFNGPERRRRIRFPIELGARYAVHGRQEIEGTGRTVNISSQSVLITSAHEVSPDTSIRVVIEWPILMDNNCPLALHRHDPCWKVGRAGLPGVVRSSRAEPPPLSIFKIGPPRTMP